MQFRLLTINLRFSLLKPIGAVCSFPYVTSISEQPEEQLHHQSQHTHTQARYWHDLRAGKVLTTKKLQRSAFLVVYLVYFLRVAPDHDGTAARLQMRADGPEAQRQEHTNQEQLAELAALTTVGNLLRRWPWALNAARARFEPGGCGICLKIHELNPRSTNFIMFISLNWSEDEFRSLLASRDTVRFLIKWKRISSEVGAPADWMEAG